MSISKHCPRCQDRHLTIEDVQASFQTHMLALDALWPESERYGPRKINIVELLDGIRLDLHKRAKAAQERHFSAFEHAAHRITGHDPSKLDALEKAKYLAANAAPVVVGSGDTSASHAALRDRIKRNNT